MKKFAAAVAAAVAVLAMAALSGVALAGDHHGDHGKPSGSAHHGSSGSSDTQAGEKPSSTTHKNTSCSTGGGSGSSATCTSDTSSRSDASKRYGNGKTAAQIANGHGAPSGTQLNGPGNSQPHKVAVCGKPSNKGGGVDVHAVKHYDQSGCASKQQEQKQLQSQAQQQMVTFCDMDTATTGKLETKPAGEVAHHEFNGKAEENRDIVPPFTLNGQTFSENWPSGQAIFNANCNESAPPAKAAVQEQSAQMVTFCDMDTATTGKLETHPASEVSVHEFKGNAEENRDIVPPFTYGGKTWSENWPSGQAIFNANCNESAPPAKAAVQEQSPSSAVLTPSKSAAAQVAPVTPPASGVAAATTPSTAPATTPASGVKGASKTIAAPAASSKPSSGVLGTAKTLGSTATSGTLPFTGLRLWIVELIALGLIGGGVAMRLIARRRLN
jgi:hypothetical protein